MKRLYIGTYTRNTESRGIYCCDWDAASGTFSGLTLAARADNPSFLVAHGSTLLAANEVTDFRGQEQGAVSSYRITSAGLELSAMLPSHGADPCHLAVGDGEVAVANYSGGTVARLALAHGVLTRTRTVVRFAGTGPHRRQASAHPHGVYYHGGELLVADLGGDCVHRLRQHGNHSLAPLRVAAGSGPRHLAIAASGRIYVVNELANTVDVLEHGHSVQTVTTLPAGAAPGSSNSFTAEIALNAAEDRLLVSNRGHDSLVSWPLDAATGRLGEPAFCPTGGRSPRHFLIDPAGWIIVANQASDSLTTRQLMPDGTFGTAGDSLLVPSPVCIAG
ncbi:MAG: lactonase family protein [Pseudomonadales bacterium]